MQFSVMCYLTDVYVAGNITYNFCIFEKTF